MNTPVDEFETVKQLLASAAAYAESASRQADRNAVTIANDAEGIAKLETQISELREAQKKTEEALEHLGQRVEATNGTSEHLGQRVNSFVFEAQRLHIEHAQKINRLDAMIDRYDGVLAYLMRKDHPEME